jgi:hypothetical protein
MIMNEHDLLAEINRLKGENDTLEKRVASLREDYKNLLSLHGCMSSEYACYVEKVEAMRRGAITLLRDGLKDD